MSTLGMTPFKYEISYFFLFWQQNWMFATVVEMRMLQPSTNSYQTISTHEWIQVVNSWTFLQFHTAFFHVHSINLPLKSSFLIHSYDFSFSGLKIMVVVVCRMIYWSTFVALCTGTATPSQLYVSSYSDLIFCFQVLIVYRLSMK